MDRTRRLILRLIGIAGAAIVLPPQELLSPEPWERISKALAKPSSLDKETLRYFEQLTTWCWYLSNGSNLEIVEQLLTTYLSKVATLAKHPSAYQQLAARIASQGYQLAYVITSHREEFKLALAHCKQARFYGQIADDPNLEAAALVRQGVVGLHRKRPYQTLDAYEEALQLVKNVSPLLRTRIYAGLCEVYGKLGQEQVARSSIGLAYESFPDNPEDDLASVYIHFSKSGLYLHE